MSRLPRRPVLLAPVVAIAAALTLTACGNDGVAVQSKEHTVAGGVNGEAGSLLIRNAQLTLGGGGVALLGVALYNEAQTADALTGVTGPDGTSFTLPTTATAYDGAYTGATPSDTVTVAVTPSASPSPASTTARSAGASASSSVPSAAAPAAASGATLVAVPAETGVFLNAGLTQIVVRNLSSAEQVGNTVPITFTFLGAGSVTLQVPITAGAGDDLSGDGPLPTVSGDAAKDGPESSTPPATVTATTTATATATVTAPTSRATGSATGSATSTP